MHSFQTKTVTSPVKTRAIDRKRNSELVLNQSIYSSSSKAGRGLDPIAEPTKRHASPPPIKKEVVYVGRQSPPKEYKAYNTVEQQKRIQQ